MRYQNPESLSTTVEAKASNRPIKVAYLVPFDDNAESHMVLDAVFAESYTRWGGVFTLILPTSRDAFQHKEYEDWLDGFDPDFVYSYVGLNEELVERVDRLACPIAFISHEIRGKGDRETDWRSFLPNWETWFQSIPSISTAQCPATYPRSFHPDRPQQLTILTQYGFDSEDRFLADNFGVSYGTRHSSNPISGFFRTLCLVPEDLPENVFAGTEQCTSGIDAFKAISAGKATPISRLASVHSEGIARPQPALWSGAFRLFVGCTVIDRIQFWNARHFSANWGDSVFALLVQPAQLEEASFVEQLGDYLNHNNFLGHSNGPRQVELHSASIDADTLKKHASQLNEHSWNSIGVGRTAGTPPIPTKDDLRNQYHKAMGDTSVLRLSEDFTDVFAEEPEHLTYVPAQRRGAARGQWIVELDIQRHHNLSRYSNVIDTWTLPRRRDIAFAFTRRLAKPTAMGRLALLPSSPTFPFPNNAPRSRYRYGLSLPTDESFFRHLVLNLFPYPTDDLRHDRGRPSYSGIDVSDKGQNLRGVIALFDQLHEAYEILTHRFFRSVLDAAKKDSTNPLTFGYGKLHSLIPNDRESIRTFTETLRLNDAGVTKRYIHASLKDTIEQLVRSCVFYQVATWRCDYCGHLNSRSFDNMKMLNACSICEADYLCPIDVEWKFELSSFVHRSLKSHSGLPVLWTLGFLQDRMMQGSFWYVPEVNLFEGDRRTDTRKEIDILCIRDSSYYMIEVKRSVSTFLNQPGAQEKFIELARKLQPDVAMLSFERYCNDDDDLESIKNQLADSLTAIKGELGPWINLETLVAQDIAGFSEFDVDLGSYGWRIHEFN